jgi:hypothetical protein
LAGRTSTRQVPADDRGDAVTVAATLDAHWLCFRHL